MTHTILTQERSFNNSPEPFLDFFYETLPPRPYCTDELGQLFVRVKEQAVKRRYIQQNSPFDLCWLVYDVDRPTAHFDWQDLHAPPPNITARNVENGHAHLFYGLEVPVIKCEKNPLVRKAPIRYAASIDIALTKKLEADPGYAGLICKNPLHESWDVQVWEKFPYDLAWIADYLDLEPYKDLRKHLPPIGLGRNCTLFDVSRRWAYSQIKKKATFLSVDFFIYEVTQYACKRNLEFPVPLPENEVKHIGKSIGNWTWENMSPEGFQEWGDRRREKSIEVRAAKSQNRAEEIKAYKQDNPKASNRAIAKVFEVNEITVRRALKN